MTTILNKLDLLTELKVRMENRITKVYSDEFLLSEIKAAIGKVANRAWIKADELTDEVSEHIVGIALYNVALIGGDFQSTHSENGIARTFVSERQYLDRITPQARVI